MKVVLIAVLFFAMSALCCGQVVDVIFETNLGDIELELYPDKAPITVENFLGYVNSGFYDGLIFHRVIEDFIIQSGAYDSVLNYYPGGDPIINESYNGLSNLCGTIAMARTIVPDSATTQFYINHADNLFLDRENAGDGDGYGYCVFGKITSGLDVMNAIAQTPTGSVVSPDTGLMHDVPTEPIIIYHAIPEPATLLLLGLGSLVLRKKIRN